MATYVIGDIQGCYDPLARLLDKVNFDPAKDRLWCVGDLVNRGPNSLAVLNTLYSLGDACRCVLGNHDIHLLAMVYGIRTPKPNDTLSCVLSSAELPELTYWLRNQPLMAISDHHRAVFCHAGIYPFWSLEQAQKLADEVSLIFQNESSCIKLLSKIYNNKPSKWKSSLGRTRRSRFIINAFTRMRFVSPKGHLNLTENGYRSSRRKNRLPWFELRQSSLKKHKIVFGHWSALGFYNKANVLCLDSGCVWGQQMTMVKLVKYKKEFKKVAAKHIWQEAL